MRQCLSGRRRGDRRRQRLDRRHRGARDAAGARVVIEPRRGYGRACAAGRRRGASGLRDRRAFSTATASDVPAFLPAIPDRALEGAADFVMGSRLRGRREPGSMTPQQFVAGRMAGALAADRLWRALYRHVTVARDPTRQAFGLGMREMTYGWNLEMQMRAARQACACSRSRSIIGGAGRRLESLRESARGRHRRGHGLRDLPSPDAGPARRGRRVTPTGSVMWRAAIRGQRRRHSLAERIRGGEAGRRRRATGRRHKVRR